MRGQVLRAGNGAGVGYDGNAKARLQGGVALVDQLVYRFLRILFRVQLVFIVAVYVTTSSRSTKAPSYEAGILSINSEL